MAGNADGNRERSNEGQWGHVLVDAEEDREVGGEQQGGADEPDGGQDARHEAGSVHHVADAQRVEGGHEALAEQERPVVGRERVC